MEHTSKVLKQYYNMTAHSPYHHFSYDQLPYLVLVNVWNDGKSAQQSYAVLRDWCNENCRGNWNCVLMSCFEFECKEDAAMFKLFLI